ncbi:MAG: toxin [Lentilitoribacter sp.]
MYMKTIKWNTEKEAKLQSDKARAGIGFADCVIAIDDGRILDNLPHPTRDNQRLLVLNIEDYAYVVPYVIEDDGSWFLKTVFPSRKHTAIYLSKKNP